MTNEETPVTAAETARGGDGPDRHFQELLEEFMRENREVLRRLA